MKLYLVRHAIAEDRAGYNTDSLRPLTEYGRERMRRIAAALWEIGVRPDLIVSSPIVRASQTATILAEALEYRGEIGYSDALVPSGDSDDMMGEIIGKFSVDELMLVGHEPSMSRLASMLMTGGPDLSITFKKGGVCCLSMYDRQAVLEWLVTPKISVRVG